MFFILFFNSVILYSFCYNITIKGENMEIIKITPQGFCLGVIKAIQIINKALEDPNLQKPIYMYGGLVHNKHIINAYKEKGVIIVDDIFNIYKGTIVITAHGVSDEIINLIKERNLGLINTTCKYVYKTHNLIKEKLSEGYEIIFFGKKTHPETKGVLGIDSRINLIESINDIDNLNIDSKNIVFTTQTTMSYIEVEEIIEKLIKKYPFIKTFEDVCSATKSRQMALINQAKDSDLCIVVGDPKSNNTNKLKEVCLKYTNAFCIMIENVEDLKNIDFSKYQKISVTAGASTPPKIVDEVINGIKNNQFNSKLKSDDYLKF